MKIEELKPGQKFRFDTIEADYDCQFIGLSPCGKIAAWWQEGERYWHPEWHHLNCCEEVLVDDEEGES